MSSMAANARELDLESARRARRLVVSIEGMWCAGCAMAVERVIARIPGVSFASTSFAGGSALVRWDNEEFDPALIIERVAKLGYRVAPLIEADEMERRIDMQARAVWLRLSVALFFGMWSMLGTLILYLEPMVAVSITGYWLGLGAVVAAVPVITYAAWPFYRMGWRTLRAGLPGMDALISLGVLAASALSFWQLLQGRAEVYIDTATMLVTFLLIGRLIELYARRRSSAAVNALRQAVPETAALLRADGRSEEVRVSEIRPGDLVMVRAGERIGVDGRVVEGDSDIDRALVSGEALPVAVSPGAKIEAGCVNLSSKLLIEVGASYGERFIDRIGLRMLELSGAKSQVAILAERFARWLVPVALSISALAFVYGYFASGSYDEAALRALSVLVAACPCAVGLALPLAYATSTQFAAHQGMLFRDPGSMEALAGARSVLFDKTGTLTSGELELVEVVGSERRQLLLWAAQAEAGIAHPIARAIEVAARREGVSSERGKGEPRRFGQGSSWHDLDSGVTTRVGAAAWLAGQGIVVPSLVQPLPAGATRVEIARDAQWVGALILRDRLLPDAIMAVSTLEREGLTVNLVTGDRHETAVAVAAAVGLAPAQVRAGCLPEDKVTALETATEPAIFVGDGFNDSLALAAADCGIAVQGAAAPALASAGVVITQGGLAGVVGAWRQSRRTLRVVRQNLGLSVVYNVGVLGFAASGAIPPSAAAVAMLLSSLSVVANSARLARPVH
ncbi:heavy metal translocating P-type ATPase [Billgrantia lactosivorans]|uniref:heavy metal translocating P-type ATPase n=1 Tax=Billgrantia lactosivorans TaxID=2185141 RepID=UPI0013A70ADD|nr:cation-translocating P-type ATPase [Halomonas lactosivorans]